MLNHTTDQVPLWKRAKDKMGVTLSLAKPRGDCGWAEATRFRDDQLAPAWQSGNALPPPHKLCVSRGTQARRLL